MELETTVRCDLLIPQLTRLTRVSARHVRASGAYMYLLKALNATNTLTVLPKILVDVARTFLVV